MTSLKALASRCRGLGDKFVHSFVSFEPFSVEVRIQMKDNSLVTFTVLVFVSGSGRELQRTTVKIAQEEDMVYLQHFLHIFKQVMLRSKYDNISTDDSDEV